MKKQEGKLLLKRAKLRKHIVMSKLNLPNNTYQKIMGQLTNGKRNAPFNDDQVKDIESGVKNVIKVCHDFLKELKKPDQ